MQLVREKRGAHQHVPRKTTEPQKVRGDGICPERMSLLMMINWPFVDSTVHLETVDALMRYEGVQPPPFDPVNDSSRKYIMDRWIPWFVTNCERPSNTELYTLVSKIREDAIVFGASIVTTLTHLVPQREVRNKCRLKII
ncbi:ORF26 [Ictalurid herpesvirus 1]|uniref:Uncharacterized protein ORF26 n=1 Tax=Ictalurid herpesvirus 1 (strain Auburn) TaxID=766178 RepID=VG26_ICHVA|nr:ORF26 [Ictalurid herpesvirus 1]Q00147.1 RecName: Full=Uncharacterized protein ORF26 [Ictalurid herpesvirus 1 (strain Auburn)]AAA88129.1 ORF26 [Ictalurid herpesvirus 1]